MAAIGYPYHVVRDPDAPFVKDLPTIEADDPKSAIAKLANAGLLPDEGTFWVRIVTETHDNGMPRNALSVPLTVEAKIPIDWR